MSDKIVSSFLTIPKQRQFDKPNFARSMKPNLRKASLNGNDESECSQKSDIKTSYSYETHCKPPLTLVELIKEVEQLKELNKKLVERNSELEDSLEEHERAQQVRQLLSPKSQPSQQPVASIR